MSQNIHNLSLTTENHERQPVDESEKLLEGSLPKYHGRKPVMGDLFKKIRNIEPSHELKGKILKAIQFDERRAMRKKLLLTRLGLVVCFGAMIYSLAVFGRLFLQSDFWNLAKLLFTDTGIIAGHIGDFSISLLENLPALEIFALLLPIFALSMMLSYYFKFTQNRLNFST